MQIKIGTFIFISNIQKVGEALPLNEKIKKTVALWNLNDLNGGIGEEQINNKLYKQWAINNYFHSDSNIFIHLLYCEAYQYIGIT